MNFLTNITHAAENPIVSCTGFDCGVCSLLETVSNAYNFFLAVSCAVAILFLVVAGAHYILASRSRAKIQKSWYFLKSGIIGFALIILGWLVVQGVIRMVGYQNAGFWWQFQCGREDLLQPASDSRYAESFKISYYDNLPAFPDLATFLKSTEDKAKIEGPLSDLAFENQLRDLKNGEILHFLAPARVDSMGGAEDLYLPLITVKKEGNKVSIENTGEYWDLIQNLWPKLAKQQVVYGYSPSLDNSEKQLLNNLLGTVSYTDNRSVLAKDGSVIDGSSQNTDLTNLYGSVAKVLGESLKNGDRAGLLDGSTGSVSLFNQADGGGQAALSRLNLSDLIAQAASYNQGENNGDTGKIVSVMTVETLKLVSTILVDKESSEDILSTPNWQCVNSGGEWLNDDCKCPDQTILGEDKACHSNSELKENCEKTAGLWKKAGDGFNSTPPCGASENTQLNFLGSNLNSNLNSNGSPYQSGERADISQAISSKDYCQCQDKFCLDDAGSCREQSRDDDGDKIVNTKDRCPNTPSAEKNTVNRMTGNKFYGCGCSEIGMVRKECPPDQCVGENKVIYPNGKQECKNGQLLPYSCKPVERNFSETCLDQNKLAQRGNSNANDNYIYNNNYNFNYNNNYNLNGNTNKNVSAGSNTGGANASSGGQSQKASAQDKKKKEDDVTKEPPGGDNVPPGDGNDGSDSERGKGRVEDLKKALKRIYERDKLRYEMIFRNVKVLSRTSFPGGMCTGCGSIYVNASLPLGIMDQVIVHESTHSAHGCVDRWGSTASVERIACANQMGSLCRAVAHQDMKEFKRQTAEVEYMGKEVRGYISRRQTKVNPKGDLGTSAYHWPIAYALSYGDKTMGPFHYGDHDPGMILGLKNYEEAVVRKVMEDESKCLSKPPADLPPVEACNNAPEMQFR